MVSEKTWHDQWAEVDHTSDPGWFIRFLDASRGQMRATIQQNPRQFYTYLDVQEGHYVLDVGSGTGDFTRPLADIVGPSGRVVCVDYSHTMVEEAVRRAAEEGSHVEFQQGDIHDLDFEGSSFDRVQARAVFQHLRDPRPPLAELIRVLKPGGKLAIADVDWETLAIDASDKTTTRKVANMVCDSLPNGWIGRQLAGLFREAGLQEVAATGATVIIPNYDLMERVMEMHYVLKKLQEAGQLSEEQASAWVADLKERSEAGRFLFSFTLFTVTGVKSVDKGL